MLPVLVARDRPLILAIIVKSWDKLSRAAPNPTLLTKSWQTFRGKMRDAAKLRKKG